MNSLEVISLIRVRLYTFFDAARKSSAEVCRLSYTSFSDPFVVELDVFDVWYSTFFSFFLHLPSGVFGEMLPHTWPAAIILFLLCQKEVEKG